MKDIKVGDRIAYKNVGYGLTSYEDNDDTVIEVGENYILTDCFNAMGGMKWNDAAQTYKFDGGLGLVCYAVPIDDPKLLEYLANEEE